MNNSRSLDKIQTLKELQKDSSDSLRRTLIDAEQTFNVGQNIMTELDVQKEQIKNMETNIELINDNNKRATRLLMGIKSIFGSVTNRIFYNNDNIKTSNQQQQTNPNEINEINAINETNTFNASLCNSMEHNTNTRDIDEDEQNLDYLQNIIGKIYNMSMDMNTELTDQNYRLEKLKQSVDEKDLHINANNIEIKNILRK
jgi:hypothetical protein